MDIDGLGLRIRQRREKLGLRQLDLAHALRVSPQAVSKWERGENAPDIATLVPLGKLLSTSTDWLLGYTCAGEDVFEATVLFADIGGFARVAQGMPPTEMGDWLNAVFFQLTEVVLKYQGVPVKYIGDAFLCFFAGSEHRERAVHAAIHAIKVAPQDPRYTLAIGMNAGDIYLGAIGHPDYARPDILGDAVNLAAQVEACMGREGRSGIAATASVVDNLQAGVEMSEPRAVKLKGRSASVTIHEIIVA